MNNILEAAFEMVNKLYIDGEYREALNGLFLIKKTEPYGDDKEFNKLIDNLIKLCIKKLR